MKMPLSVLRWLHRQHFSRPKLRGGRLHRWLGDRLLDKSLWRATPESVARAWLVGFFVTAIPFLPLQTVIAGAIGFGVRANLILCIGLQYLSNPVTAIVHVPACYFLGKLIMGYSPVRVWHDVTTRDWKHLLTHPTKFAADLLPTYLGSVVLGLVVGVAGYWMIRTWGESWQRKHPQKRKDSAT